MICDSIISPHLCIATKGQRSRVCGKLFCRVSFRWWSTGVSIGTLTQLPRNARRNFFQTHARRCGVVSNVKVKKRRRQDILRFRAHARKLILGSIGTPLDHLSVKRVDMFQFSYIMRYVFLSP